MAARRIPEDAGRSALERWTSGTPEADDEALSVRFTLQILKQKAPGSSVEVRVPPWGAVQAVEGTTHTRGTPPAVVEMAPTVWLQVATGAQTFEEALTQGLIQASGDRSNLSAWLPLLRLP